jgi:mutator protein MutT
MPRERANLCFIIKDGKVLLIRKKRGLGAGKINAPGGKLEPGETARDAAIRETREEVGVTPLHLEERGFLRFQFTDGYSLSCAVFVARDFEGELIETDEATPQWCGLDAVPYHEMWADDFEWLPEVLAGGTFTGSFVFENESMLEKDVRFHGPFVHSTDTFQRRPRVLVAGCGFVGLATARLLLSADWDVTGCTHSHESALALAAEPFPVLACDIANPAQVAQTLGPMHGLDAVVHCASSSKGGVDVYREVYLRGAQILCGELAPRHIVFTSSTSVYAQTGGEWVDEQSAAEPPRETGRVLLETESWVLGHGGAVARLAGIYGPGRSVLLRKFFSGEAVIEGDGRRWLNQIHRDDAAAAIVQIVQSRLPGLFNVSDDSPISQIELYSRLAESFSISLPPSGPIDVNRKRGWTHKRVRNGRLRSLGWAPKYASFFNAVADDPELVRIARASAAAAASVSDQE